MYPTNLSQLKKFLTVGRVITLTNRPQHKANGQPRKIDIAQSNAIRFEGGSWLYYTKASDYTFTPEGFDVTEEGFDTLKYIYN